MIRDEDQLPRFLPIGTFSAMSSNRISHFFDLRGASMTVDTGCSTTLVALHQAMNSLRTHESDMSIVSGSNLLLGPDMFKVFGSLGMLSPDGKSYAFDSRANGYGRGEGVATIVIKRLNDALACGDPVRALIRETCLNQDGKTETITTPSQAAQEELMLECYRRAGLDPQDTQYFEAHGTGTPTGDPIEARAIAGVLGGSSRKEPLRIGSLKTNIGHTEAASGLASLIKVVLALENDQIPPSVNYESPNPKLALERWNLKVAQHLEKWPVASPQQPRRASVNNFGYGGSNAHVILEGVDSNLLHPKHIFNGIHAQDQSKVLVLSARDEKGCQRMVSDLVKYLRNHSSTEASALMQNLSYTLGERRSLFPWVAANVVRFRNNNIDEVIQSLESPQFVAVRMPAHRPRVGMVFTGQGAQWHAMGRELMDMYPSFRATLEEAEKYLRALGAEWSLLEELQRDAQTSKVNTTALSIPVCVALQISLVRLLASWDITPAAVTSHSSGEIAAAYAVGALTLRQAMAAAYYRSALAADPKMHSLGEKGGMIAIGLGPQEAQKLINRLTSGSKVVVACINSPHSVTVAGDISGVIELEELCKQESVFARRLRVDTGYHSHHMQPIAQSYLDLLQQHMPNSQNIGDEEPVDGDETNIVSFSSPVTGGRINDMRHIATPEHWVSSLLEPVRFVEAFTDMILNGAGTGHPTGAASNVDILIEVGPHTALAAPIREILSLPEFEGLDLPYYGSLVRNEHAGDTMRSIAVNLLREGLVTDMHSINFPRDDVMLRVLTDLPSYPWNHSIRHWQESRINRSIRARDQAPDELLGTLIPGTNLDAAVTWRNILRVAESSWISDHVVQDNIVYPGAGYICLAIAAIKQLTNIQKAVGDNKEITGYRLRDIEFQTALVIPDDANGIEVQTNLTPVSNKVIGARDWKHFEISSVTSDARWTIHAKGLIRVDIVGSLGVADAPRLTKRPLSSYSRHVDPHDMFSSLRSRGIYHGPKFQNTARIVQDGHEPRCISYFTIADTSLAKEPPPSHVLHPTTLDSIILSSYSALPGVGALEDDAKLPHSIQKLWVSSNIGCEAGHAFQCHTSLSHVSSQNMQANLLVVDEQKPDAEPVLEMVGLVCQSMGRRGSVNEANNKWQKELVSKVEWAPDLSLKQPKALAEFKRQYGPSTNDIDREFVIRLRRVCFYYCQDALQGLTARDIAQLEPHLVKFHNWMRGQLELAALKVLAPDSHMWISDGPKEREKEIALAATQSVEGEMVCRLGPHLVSMIRGERPPLEVMMEGRLLYKYYADATRMRPSLERMAALLRQVVHKNPGARILEIGGGTGGATRHMLKALGTSENGGPLAAVWHFTDLSTGFFEAARTEFTAWSDILKFDKLDIEKGPASQGFTLGSYDIVVACEVLHATKSMARTMANVHSLMKPNGTLLLMETTQDQADLQFIFGLLPGWWLSEEPERQSSPSLTLPFWDRVLKDTGFSGIELDVPDSSNEDLYSISVIMSRVSSYKDSPEQLHRHLPDDIVLVISNKETLPSDVIDSLKTGIKQLTDGTTDPRVLALEDATDSCVYSGKICVFLGEAMQPILHNIDQADFEAIKAMTTSCKGLIWITVGGSMESTNPNSSLSHGILRTLRSEYMGRRYYSLDLDETVSKDLWPTSTVPTIVKLIELGFCRPDLVDSSTAVDFEYAERNGVLFVPRLYKDTTLSRMLVAQPAIDWQDPKTVLGREAFFQQDRPLRLEVGIPGFLDTLSFADHDLDINSSMASDMVEIEPRAYGLNFRDVMVAMGQLKENVMGLECSGVITRVSNEARDQGFQVGDRVMALLLGPFTSRARISWHGVVHIPEGMSFEDAASLPMVFSTAYVSLVDIARFQRGQSVLIHAAAGGVGQAAIMLSKYLGAGEIYVTVSSSEKRKLIEREYNIPSERIFSSRDQSFAPGVLSATGGRGVDVVLNSLAGPLLQASFDVLSTFGHLVEIGKTDLEGNSLLEMGTFARSASYTSLDMMTLLRQRGKEIHRVLSVIARLVQKREIGPVFPVTSYSMNDCVKGFRLLQTGKHMGKIVLSTNPAEEVNVRPRAVTTAKLRADASYLLVGGVGGLGRSIARSMVDCGAKNLILLSRSAGDMGKPSAFVNELRDTGCRVVAICCDVGVAGQLSKALRSCEDDGLPPVRGVIQGAMVLRDSVFEQMTMQDWQTCIQPKVHSTWNLHVQWSQPGTLDFFIMLSSFSGLLGTVSQANYAAGSVYQDAMAHWRQSRGLPGVSLDLAAVKGVGYAAETAGVAERMRRSGETLPLEETTVLQAIQAVLISPATDAQVLLGLNMGPGSHWDKEGKSRLSRDARFLALAYRESRNQESDLKRDGGTGGVGGQNLAGKLAEAESPRAAAELVGEAISTKLASIFMIPANEIDLTQPPALYGVDSLIAVELRNMLTLQAGTEVSIFNIMQSVSLAALAFDVAAKIKRITEVAT
jgi:acyl transferase domain-containing protein/NADPH:quinone reductase-like Zn-dependent oxidoreductase/NAD(P)-dependent dehydrogenase (short-subunit alcohol dehydrogenase family)/2-polyprenyl-3-methyl-5-hydroxy-6-metoxy-1,4-benzoquinol methylase